MIGAKYNGDKMFKKVIDMKKKFIYIVGLLFLLTSLLMGCADTGIAGGAKAGNSLSASEAVSPLVGTPGEGRNAENKPSGQIEESGEYTSKEDVAAYLSKYGHLPENYITKKEAKALGWVSSEGNLQEAAPGKSIGGDHFGKYEEILPEKDGREYFECDIDSSGGYRGAKRLVYSNDGLTYYTEDHYKTFELLCGEE